MKKSSVLTFLFSLFPGAGHMYLGLMKKGASLMLIFCALFSLASFLGLSFLAVFLPVIWFYAFFDAINLRNVPYEERMAKEDRFLFDMGGLFKKDWLNILRKRHLVVGVVCIFFGAWILFQNCVGPYLYQLEQIMPWLYNLIRSFPTIVVATAVILLGIYLVFGGRKKALPADPDFIEYGGTRHDGE